MIRIASFNVENLFARPKVFDLPDWNAGQPVLKGMRKSARSFKKPNIAQATKYESAIFSLRWRYMQSTRNQKQFAATTQ
jgi:hypothetical protein